MVSKTSKLTNSKISISNIELVDHVISIQLKKIENYYDEHEKYTASNINSDAENAMANLIELLKLRKDIKK